MIFILSHFESNCWTPRFKFESSKKWPHVFMAIVFEWPHVIWVRFILVTVNFKEVSTTEIFEELFLIHCLLYQILADWYFSSRWHLAEHSRTISKHVAIWSGALCFVACKLQRMICTSFPKIQIKTQDSKKQNTRMEMWQQLVQGNSKNWNCTYLWINSFSNWALNVRINAIKYADYWVHFR